VIPVLVRDADMPGAADLPEALRPLSRRQAFDLFSRRWEQAVEDLVMTIERIVPPGAPLAPAAAQQEQAPEQPAAIQEELPPDTDALTQLASTKLGPAVPSTVSQHSGVSSLGPTGPFFEPSHLALLPVVAKCLEPGESAITMARAGWGHYAQGLLVATDRRLIFVGANLGARGWEPGPPFDIALGEIQFVGTTLDERMSGLIRRRKLQTWSLQIRRSDGEELNFRNVNPQEQGEEIADYISSKRG
jgi:hypothetical protein